MSWISRLAAALALGAGTAAAQEPADNGDRKPALSGYAEASYSYSTRNAGNAIVGRLYDRFHDQGQLNALAAMLDLPHDPAAVSAGFRAQVMFGQNASVIKSAGFSLGDQGDVPQLYVTLNLPTGNGNGLQIKAGRMPTLLGLEVIADVANPNWSEGSQFIYVENFTQTGLSLERKFSDRVDAQLRIFNGWDVVQDNNTRKSFMGRVGFYPAEGTTVAVLGFWGPEQSGDAGADRYGGELLAGAPLAPATTGWLQVDIGGEQANRALPNPDRDARWWAVGVWLTRDLSSKVGLALRGDYVDDRDGARTSGVLGFPPNTGHKFGSATLTLNVRSWPDVLLRPELRYDRSSLQAFDDRKDQVTFGVSAAYLF